MDNLLGTFKKGLNVGVYYAGLAAPVAAVIVVASWFKSK